MSAAHAAYDTERDTERFGSGVAGAVVLHVAVAVLLAGVALFQHFEHPHWGEQGSQAGAIQASMVSALPLPQKVAPVKDQVLAPDDPSSVPKPPPKEATQPPPLPTDVLIKNKTRPAKTAPVTNTEPPKHPQTVPPSAKAQTGESATQLPQSLNQVQHGTAALTVANKAFGDRYAYYLRIVGATIARNWFTQEADPRASVGKSVTVTFEIERDGTPANVRVKTASGSRSLDDSAIHALQRVDGFGPLPAGNEITVDDTFDYHP